MPISEVIYLGPPGTFSHEMAQKRFHDFKKLIACESVEEICEKVAAKPGRRGVVPIVNSSGGMIYETVDGLLDPKLSLCVEEELSLNVRLALLGRKNGEIRTVYSHFAPLKHCGKWLKSEYPGIDWVEVGSTGIAAREASINADSAAICNKRAAAIYGLDILRYPVPGLATKNVTHFFIIGKKCKQLPRARKTSLAVYLPNRPGSLYDFLRPLADAGMNLSRLISRPIPGKPTEFAFFIDVDENIGNAKLRNALAKAEERSIHIRVVGCYPSFRVYGSA